ncbi:MAG: M50 family metallopeptidase [Roseburia sp.]|nr:M50 family metallopeptidase [Roseburia sp.]
MSEKSKKKKVVWQQYIAVVFFMLIGAACGILMVKYVDATATPEQTLGEQLFFLVVLFVLMYVAIFLQIIIHEAGHLIFGLLTGYKFSSFRIMSFMWVKENRKIKFRRLDLAGTGGQCLMAPPEMKSDKLPVVLYNLGGSLMNVIAGLVFLGVYFASGSIPFLSTVMLMLAIIGFAFAIMNGVPMRMGTVDNDGYNAFALTGNHDALRSFWVQMKTNEQIAKGVRLKDMPEEWFTVPSDEEMKNSMVAVMGVFACNRLVDAHRFEEAEALMEHLLEIDGSIVGLHRSLMVCDRMYCELIGENRREVLEQILTKEQKKFMKSMKKFPAVLRTEYAYTLLLEKDTTKAKRVMAQFKKCAKTYPYPSDVQSERELIEIAKIRYEANFFVL